MISAINLGDATVSTNVCVPAIHELFAEWSMTHSRRK